MIGIFKRISPKSWVGKNSEVEIFCMYNINILRMSFKLCFSGHFYIPISIVPDFMQDDKTVFKHLIGY